MLREDIMDRGPEAEGGDGMALDVRDRRRHPRARVCWPVIVETGSRRLYTETLDISSFGGKLRMDQPIELGSSARLHFCPADQRPLSVHALAWRADPDGVAFFFWEVCPAPSAGPAS